MPNPFITKQPPTPKFINLNKSAGILDDFAVRKNVATKEGTIEKVPVNPSDIVNKSYVDALITNHPHQDVNTTASPQFANVIIVSSSGIPLSLAGSGTTITNTGTKENRIFLYNNSTTVNSGCEIVIGNSDTTTGRYAVIGTNIRGASGGVQAVGDIYFATKRSRTDTALLYTLYIQGSSQNVGFGGLTNPTAKIHLPAGTSTAGTAPLKLTRSTAANLLATLEEGAIEYAGDTTDSHLYFTHYIAGVLTRTQIC